MRAIRTLVLFGLVGGCQVEDGPNQVVEENACRSIVRSTLERVDSLTTWSAKEAMLIRALDSLERSARSGGTCERDLLLELLEVQAAATETDKVIRNGERALALGILLNKESEARVKHRLAEAYFQLGSPKSFDLAKDVFLYWDSIQTQTSKALQVTRLLVEAYGLTEELGECRILLENALVKARRRGDPQWVAELLDGLSGLSVTQGQSSEALAEQREAIAELDKLLRDGILRDTLIAVRTEATADEATVMKLFTTREQGLLRHRLLVHGAQAHRLAGHLDSARVAYTKALELGGGMLEFDVPAAVELAELLMEQGLVEEAIARGDRAIMQATKLRDARSVQRAARVLHEGYKRQGHFARALAMNELAQAYEDSLDDRSFALGLLKRQVLYEVKDDSVRMAGALDRSELERAKAQLEARSNRTVAISTGAAGFLLLIVVVIVFRLDRKRRQARHERDSAQLEVQALRSQMNPHFIFNALNSINAFVRQNDQESASSYLVKFAKVMRAVLENSRHSEVTLREDLDALRGYLELERMRMQQKFDFRIDIAKDIDPDQVLVPPLVVQPFVENAIWHGLSGKEGKGLLSIKVEPRASQLIWTIADDGVGRTGSSQAPSHGADNAAMKKTSLGTTITRARLDLVQKQHGGKAGFRYVDVEKGTCVEVDMPLVMD